MSRSAPDPRKAQKLNALLARGDLDAALREARGFARRRSKDPVAQNILGICETRAGKPDDAVVSFRRALRLEPGYADAQVNLGIAYRDLGRLEDAAESHTRVLQLRPDHLQAHYNLGVVQTDLGRLEAAEASYRRAIALKPDYAEPHFALSHLLLLREDFANGWREYEWRWKKKDVRAHGRLEPTWDGAPLERRTILLHCEQGFGDNIQFIRYAREVQLLDGIVAVHCPQPLQRLFRTAQGIDFLASGADPLPPCDVQAPLASLPGLFGADLSNIPAVVPYLGVADEIDDAAGPRLSGLAGLRVGLVWRGRPEHPNDRNRSLSPAELAPLAATPGCSFVSLQKDAGNDEIEALAPWPGFTHVGDVLEDFADTAAALRHLDLVITVDTSVAHLAGALGRPAWVLLPFTPDWRWLRGRDDSPWYPSLRLFRQPSPGDWPAVIRAAAARLAPVAGGVQPAVWPL